MDVLCVSVCVSECVMCVTCVFCVHLMGFVSGVCVCRGCMLWVCDVGVYVCCVCLPICVLDVWFGVYMGRCMSCADGCVYVVSCVRDDVVCGV